MKIHAQGMDDDIEIRTDTDSLVSSTNIDGADITETSVYAYPSTGAYMKQFDTLEKWRAFADSPNCEMYFDSGAAMVEFFHTLYEKYGDDV